MTQDERPARRVLVRGQGDRFGGRRRRWGNFWKGSKWVACRGVRKVCLLDRSAPGRHT